jgi:hypothetical protein
MKIKLTFSALLLSLSLAASAAVLPPEKLLPADTLLLLTIPDWDKAKEVGRELPLAQFWNDPAMKPFVDKFTEKLDKDLIVPLERELGVKLSDYTSLAHGQITLALTQGDWDAKPTPRPGVVLLIDARDNADQLKTTLANLRKKWVDADKQIKTERVRDVEFSTLIVKDSDLSKSFSSVFSDGKDKAEQKKSDNKSEISIGQSGSLLLIGNSLKELEKILIRQSGGLVEALGEQPAYAANHSALFRDATLYGWVNAKPIIELIMRQLSDPASGQRGQANLGFRPDQLVEALGLTGLKTLAFNLGNSKDGMGANIFLGVPESARRGLFKIFLPEQKEAAPPAFVPADAVKFFRYRIDGQKMWASIETMLKELSPQLAGLLQMGLGAAGKDKDPDFDLKKQLIGNLGNDLISYEKKPRGASLDDLSKDNSLTLVGSPNPEQFVNAMKTSASLLNPEGAKEREFLGRKVYSVKLPPTADKPQERSFNFSASGGYVAMSTDVAMLEEYLRSTESRGKALAELVGLVEAAQKIGGMGTGWFGYENMTESLRLVLDLIKKDPSVVDKLLDVNPLPGGPGSDMKWLREWFDYSLLPSFDRIAKYFSFTVYGASAGNDGISFKSFSPTPPELKK